MSQSGLTVAAKQCQQRPAFYIANTTVCMSEPSALQDELEALRRSEDSGTGMFSQRNKENHLYPLLRHHFRNNAYPDYDALLGIVLQYSGVESERDFQQAYSLPDSALAKIVSQVKPILYNCQLSCCLLQLKACLTKHCSQ